MIVGLIISIVVNVVIFIYLRSIIKKQDYCLKSEEELAQIYQDQRDRLLQDIEDERGCKLNFLAEQEKAIFDGITNDLEAMKQQNQAMIRQQYENDFAASRQELEKNITLLRAALTAEIASLMNQYDTAGEDIDAIEEAIEDYAAKYRAILEQLKQEAAKQQDIKFYQLCLTDSDATDIYWLKQIENKLHNTEVLNKIIYKVYYEKPLTSLVGRVVSSTTRCGIYKITNIDNGMCYIGQSVNIAERWKQHLKRALGCEPMTQNKLYPAMHDVGPEHFTWQIIEDCTKDKLNEREKYWQIFYGAQEFGYSIK